MKLEDALSEGILALKERKDHIDTLLDYNNATRNSLFHVTDLAIKRLEVLKKQAEFRL